MATLAAERTTKRLTEATVADLLRALGSIPPERVWLQPPLGTATEADVVAVLEAADKRLCELVDGTLVEKPMGTKESQLAVLISYFIMRFLEDHDLGILTGADGAVRLELGLVRIPDVSFISWNRLPRGELPDDAIARIIPDLAVEVLSKSNTRREIERKLKEYFQCGVRLVWVVDPKTETAKEYTSATKFRQIAKHQSLDGGDVLPGFKLPLKSLFARLSRGKKKR
jgi:Uma2 family endonuclease